MIKLEVFDPPMCCSTGICGESDDPTLVNFASDIEWLKVQGVEVVRYNMSFTPAEFEQNEAVNNTMQIYGNGCLPIIVVNNEIVSKSNYPSRAELANFCHVQFNEDEAPPIHREENCCCGVDCDCNISNHDIAQKQQAPFDDEDELPKYAGSCCCGSGCNCSNAAAEDNCCCIGEDCSCDSSEDEESRHFKKVLLYVALLFVLVGLVAIFL